jgi:hypothetical protein
MAGWDKSKHQVLWCWRFKYRKNCTKFSQIWIQMGMDSDPWNTYVTPHRSFELHTQDGKLLNTSNSELNPICHLLALLGAHHIPHVSRIRVTYWKENRFSGKILSYRCWKYAEGNAVSNSYYNITHTLLLFVCFLGVTTHWVVFSTAR